MMSVERPHVRDRQAAVHRPDRLLDLLAAASAISPVRSGRRRSGCAGRRSRWSRTSTSPSASRRSAWPASPAPRRARRRRRRRSSATDCRGVFRTRRPIAAAGSFQYSRARFSLTTTTGGLLVAVGPRQRAGRRRRVAHRLEVAPLRSSCSGGAAGSGRRAPGSPRRRSDRARRSVHRDRRREADGLSTPGICCEPLLRSARASAPSGRILDERVRNRRSRIVSTCVGLVKPGLTCRIAWKVRIISPEATSSTTASAISATTSALRARWRWRLAVPRRPPWLSAEASRGVANLNTGMSPKSSPATSDTPA